MIKCAAIRKGNEIFVGKNHYECFKQAPSFGYLKDGEQGFLTDEDVFVSREDAAIIAYQCGQIKRPQRILLSEDLLLDKGLGQFGRKTPYWLQKATGIDKVREAEK